MSPLSESTSRFLDRFDEVTSDPTLDVTPLFHDPFFATDPASAQALTPAMLAKALPARKAMFDRVGITRIARVRSDETVIDAAHCLLTVEWSAQRTGKPAIPLKSSFLLRRVDGVNKVLVYMNHNDLRSVLAGDSENAKDS